MNFEEFYEKYYRNDSESIFVTLNHNYSHRKLEKKVKGFYPTVLEVGAGSAEHFPFVTHGFEKYVLSDIRKIDLAYLTDERQQIELSNIQNLPHREKSIDRVICTCVLHHVENVKVALQELRRVTKSGGLVSINVAMDPGWLYRKSWALTSGRRMKREGIPFPRSVHYQEHISHFFAIKALMEEIFHEDEISFKYYPFRVPVPSFNIFAVAQIRIN